MSDLISRSALLKYMETTEISQYIDEINKGNDNYNSTPLYDFVKNMPIAYDKEAVVKQLMILYDEGHCDIVDIVEDCALDKTCSECYKEKIEEIVKAGGIDG